MFREGPSGLSPNTILGNDEQAFQPAKQATTTYFSKERAMSKKTDYYSMIHEDILTERMILTVKHAINQGRFAPMRIWPCRPITNEQTQKGLVWLRKNLNRACC
jgi:hypothetical protein